ncbi:MAG: CBM96 family carbohydrate-binding protein [Planctomycetota bacterium]|jgi:hypothetical protein
MKKLIVLLLLAACVGLAKADIIADADTYVRGGNTLTSGTSNFGTEGILAVKRSTAGANKNFKSVIRFDAGSTDLSAATGINLALVLGVANTADDTFNLYGVKDASTLESFGETTLTHASSAVFVDQYLDTDTYPLGIDTSVASGYFYDSDSDGADVLASFSVSSTAAAGDAFNISTAEMLAFAQASADSLLTFVLVKVNDSGKTQFASKENLTYAGPTLTIPEPATLVLLGLGGLLLRRR